MRQERDEEKQCRKDLHNQTKLLKDKLRGLQMQRVGPCIQSTLKKLLTHFPSTSWTVQ